MHAFASIAWFPEIRNILSLMVGIGVLMGSVYLLLATNIGARLGLMVAMAGLFGWMTGMGAVWWMYGIGLKGEHAKWESRETRRRDRSRSAGLASEGGVSAREVEQSAGQSLVVRPKEIVKATPTTPVPWVPPDPETIGVTRRQFLNRSIINVMGFSLTAFALSCIGFLWPSGTGGFGSKIRIGKIDDILANIKASQGFAYYPEARMWATEYPSASLDKARKAYPAPLLPALEAGIVPLYQRCVHLGCRVPQCLTSQWFECPCHGSQYNRVGEKKGGPAPRGLDRFTPTIENGELTVDTGTIILGPPIGTNTTGQEAEGPHCISGGGEHKA